MTTKNDLIQGQAVRNIDHLLQNQVVWNIGHLKLIKTNYMDNSILGKGKGFKLYLLIAADDIFQILLLLWEIKCVLIFHMKYLLADDSYEISSLIFLESHEIFPNICHLLQSWLELNG